MNFSTPIRIALTITLMLYISSCIVEEERNITISSFVLDNDLSKVKTEINKADNYFRNINRLSNVSERKLGHIAYSGEKNIYYRNCLSVKGEYIETTYCNYDSILGIDESKQLEATINTLRSMGIIGSWYSTDTNELICILESHYKNAGDERYLFVGLANDSINNSSLTSLLERNKSTLFFL